MNEFDEITGLKKEHLDKISAVANGHTNKVTLLALTKAEFNIIQDEFIHLVDIEVTCEHIFCNKHLIVTAVVSRKQI
ncbi:MAG: hypothetical protein E6387_02375 [Veillonella sp.]|nr:hypothetical protein [Veillonella sp.]